MSSQYKIVNLPHLGKISRFPPRGITQDESEYYRNEAPFEEVRQFLLATQKEALRGFSSVAGIPKGAPRNHPLRNQDLRWNGETPVQQAKELFPKRIVTAINQAKKTNNREALARIYDQVVESANFLDQFRIKYANEEYVPLFANNFNDVVRGAVQSGLDNPPAKDQSRVIYDGQPLEGMYDTESLRALLDYINENKTKTDPWSIKLLLTIDGVTTTIDLAGWLYNELNNIQHTGAGSDIQLEDVPERATNIRIEVRYQEPKKQGAGFLGGVVITKNTNLRKYLDIMQIYSGETYIETFFSKPCLLSSLEYLYMARDRDSLSLMEEEPYCLEEAVKDYEALKDFKSRNDCVVEAYRKVYGQEFYVEVNNLSKICEHLKIGVDLYEYLEGTFKRTKQIFAHRYPRLGNIAYYNNHYIPVLEVSRSDQKPILEALNLKKEAREKFTTLTIMKCVIQSCPARALTDDEKFCARQETNQIIGLTKMNFSNLGIEAGIPPIQENMPEPSRIKEPAISNKFRNPPNAFGFDFETQNIGATKSVRTYTGCLYSPSYETSYDTIDEFLLQAIPEFIKVNKLKPSVNTRGSLPHYRVTGIAHNMSFEFSQILIMASKDINIRSKKNGIMGELTPSKIDVKSATLIYNTSDLPHPIEVTLLDSYRITMASLDDSARSLGIPSKLPYDYEWLSNEENITYLQNNNWLLPLERASEITYTVKDSEGRVVAKKPLDMSKYTQGSYIDIKRLVKDYCTQDSKLCYEVMMRMCANTFKATGYNPFGKPTIASIAWGLLVKHYKVLPKDQVMPVTGLLNDMIRKNQQGGRTGIIGTDKMQVLEEDLMELDVNSLYPYVMSIMDIPVGEPVQLTDLRHLKKYPFYICTLRITKSKPFEVSPNRNAGNNLRWNECATPQKPIELMGSHYTVQRLEEDGCEFEILDAIVWTSVIKKGFKPFIDYFYESRVKYKQMMKDADEQKQLLGTIMQTVLKLIMNSSYGKLSQQSYFYETLITSDKRQADRFLEHDIFACHREYNGRFIVSKPKEVYQKSSSYAHIGMTILDSAKWYVSRHIRVLADVGCAPVYSDTDSVFIRNPHLIPEYRKRFKELYGEDPIDSSRLGAMKIEMADIKRAVFIAPKTYMCESKNKDGVISEHLRMKGVPKSSIYNAKRSDESYFEMYQHLERYDFFIPFTVKITNGDMRASSITRRLHGNEHQS